MDDSVYLPTPISGESYYIYTDILKSILEAN